MKHRYLEHVLAEDLRTKMVFLGGPRQVGKTTLAKMIAGAYGHPRYMNWDNRQHRQDILHMRWRPENDLLIFDEIHKYAKWKSWIKGVWDTRREDKAIMVTGSSRLDVFRRGGDSLMGRYHYHRLHPFSLAEISAGTPLTPVFSESPPLLTFEATDVAIDPLFRFGGFPESFLAQSERTLRRWQRQRFERVFREDIRETESIRSLSQVELLGALLPERVGAPLSLTSLSEDVETSPNTVKAWLDLLSRNYYIFGVPPYHRRLERALKKAAKYYLWDWSEIKEDGARFENLIASHLLKFCHFQQDTHGLDVELRYLRDTAGREVDFLVTWEQVPWMLVECKLQFRREFTHLRYFGDRLGVRHKFMVTLDTRHDFQDQSSGVRVIPASRFLMALV